MNQSIKNKAKPFAFTLYVSGAGIHSLKAIEMSKKLCEEFFKGQYELEIIDLYQQETRKETEELMVIPTLIRHLPLPIKRFMGNFSNFTELLKTFEIE